MNNSHDVIIVGGGPAGVAIGIELGMNNIKTLIFEKHENPLLSPRAQSLNERSMEFFMRWGLLEKMVESVLFPKKYPIRGVWCSKLNGITYATAGSAEQFEKPFTAAKALRLPLYITENILRERLSQFSSVKMLKNQMVTDVGITDDSVTVHTKNKADKKVDEYTAKYAIGCDGANSITRESMHIPFNGLAPKRRVINLLFKTPDLEEKITVERGFLYYLLENNTIAAMGPVDIDQNIWYAQIVYQGEATSIDDIDTDALLEEISGIRFTKKILNKHFWDMQIELADHYTNNNRVFLVGDSAHAFAPTGGFGLNTGLGDVTNFAWKLAAVIKQGASEKLLNTYESERRPIAIRNLNAAEKNASDAIAIRQKFPPEKDPKGFARENARIAKQHVHASGITLGYTYNENESPMQQSEYHPTCKPGYFLPHATIDGHSIYEKLSATKWTLINCSTETTEIDYDQLVVLHIPENTFPYKYILIRPDWHIALADDSISDKNIQEYINDVFETGKFSNYQIKQVNIHFNKMTINHIPLWEKWITVPHVKEVWFIEGYEPADYIYQKIKGNGYDYPFIIYSDEVPIGYIVCCDLYAYRTLCKNPKGIFTNEEKGTFCLDLFIADSNHLNKGWGTKIVKLFTEKMIHDFKAKKILIDPATSNKRAIRCYEKAGFKFLKTAYDGVTECNVMQLT